MLSELKMLNVNETLSLVKKYEIVLKRQFGQNFVVDPNIINKIIRVADISPGECIIEIGAGLGTLTVALAQVAKKVIAIENDNLIFEALAEVIKRDLPENKVVLVKKDAMKINWRNFLSDHGFENLQYHLVSNLPYSIASPLIITLLKDAEYINKMTVMVQKEVAQRLAAAPGSQWFSALSLKVGYFGEAKILADISPKVFFPRPKVYSSVIRITRRENIDPFEYSKVSALINKAFSQRRKMLRSSLPQLKSTEVLKSLGIKETARPEELALKDWVALAKELSVGS